MHRWCPGLVTDGENGTANICLRSHLRAKFHYKYYGCTNESFYNSYHNTEIANTSNTIIIHSTVTSIIRLIVLSIYVQLHAHIKFGTRKGGESNTSISCNFIIFLLFIYCEILLYKN